MSAITRFLGDSPLRVILKLLVVSFVVGLIMSVFGWSPYDLLQALGDAIADVWSMGFEAFGRLFSYIVLGAAIVVPAFVVLRILAYRK